VNAAGEQAQILRHFLSRAQQMTDASELVGRAGLGTPLVVMMRVLCEDLFLTLWVGLSEENAAEYSSATKAEALKFMRVLLENGRGMIRDKSTHEDKTHEIMPRLKEESKTDRRRIDQLAVKLGLGKVYDLIYRYPSMEVHGTTFDLPAASAEAGLSSIVSLVKCIGLVVDNRVLRNEATTADEILGILCLDGSFGK
jgi:hypothetical protein